MEQPFLHDLVVTVCAPRMWWSARDGNSDGSGVQGVYLGDYRVVCDLAATVNELRQTVTMVEQPGGSVATIRSVLHTPWFGADPAVTMDRIRTVTTSGVSEVVVLASAAEESLPVTLEVRITADATPMSAIRAGLPSVPPAQPPAATGDGFSWSWRDEHTQATLSAPGAEQHLDEATMTLTWSVELAPRGAAEVTWSLSLTDERTPFVSACHPIDIEVPPGPAGVLIQRSIADLAALRMADRDQPDHQFFAAGAPWFLTLFGRDSLLAARLARQWDEATAIGTLRALAARQGTKKDPAAEEEPGKILHEVRAEALPLYGSSSRTGVDADVVLPPVYYGSIDATCLWVMLLAEVAEDRPDVLEELMGAFRAAMGWLDQALTGDGFLAYLPAGGGLSNQGWKDSNDSIRFADGHQADPPISLVEVQGYAHAAARAAAGIFEDLGELTQAEYWREWAAALAQRFRERFWVGDEIGPYPALALDAHGVPVDAIASNMGHLLGTGLLNRFEVRLVVERLMHPTLRSGFGIRTLSTNNGGYWPLGYHVGTVWPHDTAIAIDGLLREGYHNEAGLLATELMRAAAGFGFGFPELYGGYGSDEVPQPHPYPAACHPQAWSAASAAVIAAAMFGAAGAD